MNKDTILGVIRHILTFGGGYLVTKGFTDAATSDQIIGGVTALIGVVWSILDKKNRVI